MGKKYIIELEDEPLVYNETTEKAELWRVKGFKSLVFDNVGLEKLTPYNEESSLIFKVGDEIEQITSNRIGIITKVDDHKFSVLFSNGDSFWFYFKDDINIFQFTGRRYPQMAEIMNAIGENDAYIHSVE